MLRVGILTYLFRVDVLPVQDAVYYSCDMSVESNFTFDIIF